MTEMETIQLKCSIKAGEELFPGKRFKVSARPMFSKDLKTDLKSKQSC